MKVKIDTREIFHVITIHESVLAANMTEKMEKVILALLDHNVKNVVLNMKDIKIVDSAAADHLVNLQRKFNESGVSFVVFGFDSNVKKQLQQTGVLEQLNHTPTESEASDIVQMEELEREFGEI